jgi:hypothetical protein
MSISGMANALLSGAQGYCTLTRKTYYRPYDAFPAPVCA